MFNRHKITAQTVAVVNIDAKRASGSVQSLRTLSKKHAVKLMLCTSEDLDYTLRKALDTKGLKRLIIGGGDGSVSKAASLILRLRPKIELGVLPLGTANYYARTLGMHKNPSKAFEDILSGEIEKRHVCKANNHYFLIGVNIGTTSRMFAQVTDEQKKRLGKLAYVRGVLRILLNTSPPDISVKIDKKVRHYSSTELVILNQNIQEPIKLAPDVEGGDPYFEIITYGLGKNKLSPVFAVIVFALTLGKNQRYLKRIRCTSAEIDSKRPQVIAIDGEVVEKLPLKVELIKKPVNFIRSAR